MPSDKKAGLHDVQVVIVAMASKMQMGRLSGNGLNGPLAGIAASQNAQISFGNTGFQSVGLGCGERQVARWVDCGYSSNRRSITPCQASLAGVKRIETWGICDGESVE
jgi:hypothetical protein